MNGDFEDRKVTIDKESGKEIVISRGSNFYRMKSRDILLVFTYLIIIVVTISLTLHIGHEKEIGNDVYKKSYIADFFTIIAEPILIGISLAILDRVGLLFPVERSVRIQIDNLANQIVNLSLRTAEFSRVMDEERIEQRKLMRMALNNFEGFEHYKNYVGDFGLHSIVGIQRDNSNTEDRVTFIENNFIPDLIVQSKAYEILYLNSFISNISQYEDAIKKAVERGSNIKMLLARPDLNSRLLNARWTDAYKKIDSSRGFENFVSDVTRRYERLNELAEEFPFSSEIDEQNNGIGSFQLRAYDISLNLPLIIIKDKKVDVEPTVAYSGFYLREDAAKLPFIQWRSGSYDMIANFNRLFENKWETAKIWPNQESPIINED